MILAMTIPPKNPGELFRRPVWKPVSPIPMQAICEAANRLRERVAIRFDADAEVFASAPFIPQSAAITALLDAAEIFEVQTAVGRAWLVLERSAAKRLVGLAFGESSVDCNRSWSPIEARTLLNLMRDMAACLAPILTPAKTVQPTGDFDRLLREVRHVVSFHLNAPVDAEVHCLFAFDPSIESLEKVPVATLLPVSLPLRAVAGTISMTCAQLATLQIGTVLPMNKEGRAQLFVGTTEVAQGACGVIGGRLAFRIGDTDESRGE